MSMNAYFFYEDGQGKIMDEQGNDAMDWVEEVDPHHLETLTALTRYQEVQQSERGEIEANLEIRMRELENRIKHITGNTYNVYTADQKVLFVYYLKVKLYKDARAGRLVDIAERTAQTWAKKLREDPQWNIFEKKTNINKRKTSQLKDEQRDHLINFFDENPQARVIDAVDNLVQSFENFSLKETSVRKFLKDECNLSFKRVTLNPVARNGQQTLQKHLDWVQQWAQTDIDFLTNCVFIDETGFNINMRPPSAWSARGTPAVITTATTKVVSHTVLGASSALGVVQMELRVPEVPKRRKIDGGRKRKATETRYSATKGTTTGHYEKFISNTLDEMDKNLQMKEFYVIMDNAPIHTSSEIEELINKRGYKCVYLPPYSPELNSIEQFWSVVKHKVKRSEFADKEDLRTRIADACNSVPIHHLKAFIRHSVDHFDDCLKKRPI